MVDHLNGDSPIAPFDREANLPAPGEEAPPKAGRGVARGSVDMSQIRGQEHAKRALEVAAAGGHNILFSGPPGSGKTLLARTLPSILPALTHDEALDVTKIYSVGGLLPSSSLLIRQRPLQYTVTPWDWAAAIPTSAPRIWSTHMDTRSTLGITRPSAVGKPSRIWTRLGRRMSHGNRWLRSRQIFLRSGILLAVRGGTFVLAYAEKSRCGSASDHYSGGGRPTITNV